MKYSFLFLTLWALCVAALPARSQSSGDFFVNGDQNTYYPVTFYDGGWTSAVATRLEIGRSDVHGNGATSIQWYGSFISTFTYHCTNWGNGSSFINADVRQQTSNKAFIGGWADASGNNATMRILIWLRGNTYYRFNANYPVYPEIYDGVQHALPYNEPGGPSHTTKTVHDISYVNLNGLTYQENAYFLGGGNNYFYGNVGIGTATPFLGTANSGMQINKGPLTSLIIGDPVNNGYGGILQGADNKHILFMGANLYADASAGWKIMQPGKGGAGLMAVADEGGQGIAVRLIAGPDNDATPKFILHGNGNVGIGTMNAPVDYKLAVNGTIGSRKVKVTQETWADFVFAPSYALMPLAQLEAFINKNQHLPEIPSAAEVKKEGLDVGDSQAKLLQKIEELTLYIIELNKKLEAQEKKIESLTK